MTDTTDDRVERVAMVIRNLRYTDALPEDFARAALAAADEWLPIESAPRDGTTILGCNYKMGHRGMVSFNGHEWEMVNGLTNMPMSVGFYPTHWRPLPAPPEAK